MCREVSFSNIWFGNDNYDDDKKQWIMIIYFLHNTIKKERTHTHVCQTF